LAIGGVEAETGLFRARPPLDTLGNAHALHRSAAEAAATAAGTGAAEAAAAARGGAARRGAGRLQTGLAGGDAAGGVHATAAARCRTRPAGIAVLVGRAGCRWLLGQAGAAAVEHLRHEEAHHHRPHERGAGGGALFNALVGRVFLRTGFLAGVLRRGIGG